ncbi:MAG TPA: carboxypeptidase-like regulatory domain-containing protein, partial [Flavobacteriaceae bacterium]
MKYFLLAIVLFLNSALLISQNIVVKVVDENTKAPIAFAAVKIDDFNGVISNEEGFFTLNTENLDAVTITCLGYKSKVLSIDDIIVNNNVIALEEAINELNTVYISNKRPNADSIIARVRQRLSENYGTKLYKHEVFSRETAYIDFKDLNFDVEKASHIKKKNLELANKSLDSLARAIINSKTIHFKDFKADLYVNDSTKTKLVVHKATELLDQKNSLSFEDVQKKGQNVMLKYLDTTLTYKLKTGLFKIEDSLSLKDDKTKEVQKNEYQIDNLRGGINTILEHSHFGENSMLTKILDSNLYEYNFENTSYFNDELIYVISYKPKRSRSKYTGRLFIIDDSYAIAKMDFEFA